MTRLTTFMIGALVGCRAHAEAPPPAPAPTVAVVPAPPAPEASSEPAPPPEVAPEGPFVFRQGTPAEALTDYAVGYWGSNGGAVFSSPATVRPGDVVDGPGSESLMEVGRYAVVEVPERHGFWVRDLGELGWAIELRAVDVRGAGQADLALRWRTSDGDGAEDWARWRGTRAEPPQVTSVSHSVIEIWSFRGPRPERLFAHELDLWANCCGSEVTQAPPHIEAELELEPGAITLRAGRAWRATAASFHARPLDGIQPALLPWGPVKERSYRFDAGAFILAAER